ncbi:MAG: hypothetical protein ABJQ69_03490 [Ekhidna sp.]
MICLPEYKTGRIFAIQNFSENNFVQLWEENGIVRVRYKPGTSLNLDRAKKMVEERAKIFDKRSKPLLTDFTHLISIDVRAREYLADNSSIPYISASAFLLTNMLNRLLFHVFTEIDQPAFISKGFTDEQSAFEWLEFFKHYN